MRYFIFVLVLAAILVVPGLTLAQEIGGPGDLPVDAGDFEDLLDSGTCTVNGVEVPCEELTNDIKGFLGAGIAIVVVSLLVGLVAFIFWIMMLVHAIKYPIDSKPLWIILIIITGVLGAIIYYFAVKRGYKLEMTGPPSAPPPVAPSSNMPPPTVPTQ